MDVSICIRNNPGIFIFSDHAARMNPQIHQREPERYTHGQAARMLVGSLLMKEQLTGWLYTANAATVTSPSELLLSAWIIASRPNPQQFEKLIFISLLPIRASLHICSCSCHKCSSSMRRTIRVQRQTNPTSQLSIHICQAYLYLLEKEPHSLY